MRDITVQPGPPDVARATRPLCRTVLPGQSVVEMLNNVEGLTAAVPVSNPQGDFIRARLQPGFGSVNLLPTIGVRDFNMSSLSDAT
jgi:hypothetical protein